MRMLAIECATEACSVALFDDETLIAHDHRVLGRGHAERLVPMIAALPGSGKADRITVSLGPGSFTGVRIGLATARALGFAWQAQVLGYPTLALVAAMARTERGPQPVTSVMTGGHGEWFVQDFAADGTAVSDMTSLSPADAAQSAAASLLAGTQAEALLAARGHGEALTLHPDARFVAALPAHLLSPDTVPIYGRAPDAKLPA
ncbi:tRNA (adenosine(37)-N6)-threonylcarbamoyltransferase complex dimerization subunit type 1 TsaB [Allopontixanthobacter sediminis]|uniref:tRNA (Adenosine(37)-N6)-threonylcarbamoyltransferase complex dimerization subunit type 1 TsaB n=1 Tax=Allopontixanthobacter sediminis TaxID=1689985 RepID=A0A845AZ65_9SPHN|nr:tRNA (adenosine(37)-N6)-threonylcarbamoyltransferase complex dimerization subunit type 1 TsaB [Allopontixanthobacter sediminis]MXP43228.1 tRNA (adenosine(37)-N6)-threonylcarbamoyltransferase complex dimerization subunit type 1 TsaB [Allopontixanthobacter sediminis]